jgi:hypothetical protein
VIDVLADETAAAAGWRAWFCAATAVRFKGAPGALKMCMVAVFLGGGDGLVIIGEIVVLGKRGEWDVGEERVD